MDRFFVCRNEATTPGKRCVQFDIAQRVSSEWLHLCGDEPKCPYCGDKDAFQPADDVRTHLPENPPPTQEFELPPLKAGTYKAGGHTFVVKDSGKRQDFATGARRDTQNGKGDFSLLPLTWLHELAKALQKASLLELVRLELVPIGPLLRLAAVFGKGALKYGEHNYQKGIPISRIISSTMRHLIAYAEGDTAEDHLARR